MKKRDTRIFLFATAGLVVIAGAVGAWFGGKPAALKPSVMGSNGQTGGQGTGQAAKGVKANALFADQGPLYFSPQAPTAHDPVQVTLRAANKNLTKAKVVVIDTVTKKQTEIALKRAGVGVNGQYEYWQATIPASADYENYYFVAYSGNDSEYFTGNGATGGLPMVGLFAISPGFTTPKWAQDGVMYQIFVDRFYNGDPNNDVKTGEYTWYGSSTVHLKWGQDPETGDQGGTDQVAFSGGDLQGVQDKLPYITNQLGVNILYLNPVFTAKTNHKYGVDNYFQVDPHFGGDQALASLTSAAHQMGDKVILDGVFNHTGASNTWFQQALKSRTNPYTKWYTFTNWPTKYATFAGVQNLPKLNYGNPAVTNEIDKIAQYWLKAPYNADGWRLDAAGHVGAKGNDPESFGDYKDKVNHAVWQSFHTAVQAVDKSALIFGEFFENTVALPWLKGNQWDGSIDYGGFLTPASAWITGKDVNMNSASIATSDLENTLFSSLNELPRPAQLVQVNQLGTHDTPRFGERAAKSIATKTYPNGQSFPYGGTPNYRKDVLGAMLQMTYTGLPTIYYGDEYGMMGGGTNDAGKRWPFDWSKTNDSVFTAYKSLVGMRQKDSALQDGSFMPLVADDTKKVFAYARLDSKTRDIVILNSSDSPQTVTVPVGAAGSKDGSVLQNVTPLLSGVDETSSFTVDSQGNIQVQVPANYGVILTQDGGALFTPSGSGQGQ